MKIKNVVFRFTILPLFLFLLGLNVSLGQDEPSEEQLAEYQAQVRQMVSFLEFSLNVLGDPTVTAKEKDVIINESFLKTFKDEKVQIEDDLVENRDVVTNKDVQAYLKDVDFFFKQAVFDFNILDVTHDLNHEGNLYFIVKSMRTLKGITVEGDSVNSDIERYIEVNVDEENKDLRVASIYTTKLSRNEELTIWWSRLSPEWKTFLGLDIEVKDGLRLSEVQEFSDSTYWSDDILFTDSIRIIDFVKEVANKEELNLSGSAIINDLKPLDEMINLRILDISSSEISDLFPIRNITTLEFLDCSNTMVEDLQPLKYSKSLKELYINNTQVTSIKVVENFENLEVFHLERTVIDSLPTVKKLSNLKDLNCAYTNLERVDSIKYLKSLTSLNLSTTGIENIEPISELRNLRKLDVSHTQLASLTSLKNLSQLEELNIEETGIDELNELTALPNLKIVYADNSKIELEKFTTFAENKPDVDIIFMSDDLADFWENTEDEWKKILKTQLDFGDTISNRDMHKILKIKLLDVENNITLSNLSPVKFMPLLEDLNFSGTSISDLSSVLQLRNLKILRGAGSKVVELSPLKDLANLQVIDFSRTEVNNISAISNLKNLDSIYFNSTKVKDINVLNELDRYKIAYFDQSLVSDEDVYTLNFNEENSLVVYKSEKLRTWWGNMDDHWQDIFKESDGLSSRPTTEQLHKIASKKSLSVNSTSLRNLDPIPEMIRLQSLNFTDSRITSLYPLISLKNLMELRCPRNPISDIEALASLTKLQILDLDNTQIKDLKPIRNLTGLKELKFSGTNVKDISPIENLGSLEVLEFSKTRVKQVNELYALNNLKTLKCYNNKISPKRIEEFKLKNPECEVVFY